MRVLVSAMWASKDFRLSSYRGARGRESVSLTRSRKDYMTTLARWDPLRELDDLSDQFSTLFGRLPIPRGGRGNGLTQLVPPVDISEDDKEFLIKAELPGIEK